ncbi:MAG TPA: LysE family translocator [Gammaproteobacteria bacterium]
MHGDKLLLFCTTVIPLAFTPGPDVIYILTRGIAQGRRAALISVLGVCSGYLVHTVLSVFGLSALIYASAGLFEVVKYAGSIYLIYLGIAMLRSKTPTASLGDRRQFSVRRMFLTGMTTSLLNPKGLLLFFAFFPLFVDTQAGDVPRQLLVIGILFTLIVAAACSTYGLLSGSIGNSLSRNPLAGRIMKWLTGTVFVGLGLRMALARNN